MLAAWSTNTSALVLAFSASNQTRVLAAANLTRAPFYMDAFGGNGTNGTIAPAHDPFAALVAPGAPLGGAARGSVLEQVLHMRTAASALPAIFGHYFDCSRQHGAKQGAVPIARVA